MPRQSPPPQTFNIVLMPAAKQEPIPLRTTTDPNQATMVFHAELQRLRREQAQGELLLLQQDNQGHPLLRQPLA